MVVGCWGVEMYVVKTYKAETHDTANYKPLLLRALGVTKRFGALVALNAVDLEVPRNSIVSLIGPNGSGKTVFFNILTGLYKPDGGQIWFNGADISGLPAAQVTTLGIARTFQNIRLFSNMSVLDNVLVGQHCRLHETMWGIVMRSAGVVSEEDRATEYALGLLHFIGLRDVAHEWAKNLPYGAQRRLEIARALATNPQMLLLDEPTAGMNPQETLEIMRLISRLRSELGLTILLVEHDMKVVMRVSDRLTVLDSGVKIAEGGPDEVRANPRVVEAYLGRGGAEMGNGR